MRARILVSVVLAEYVGEYDSDELGVTYQIELLDDGLSVRLPPGPHVAMLYTGPDAFSARGPITALALADAGFRIRFERDEQGHGQPRWSARVTNLGRPGRYGTLYTISDEA